MSAVAVLSKVGLHASMKAEGNAAICTNTKHEGHVEHVLSTTGISKTYYT